MITMKEIAKITGVSQATVSRVLSGNTSVKPGVRQLVLQCAKEHDYQPNIIAQSLVGSKSLLLGVVIPDISNPFFADIVKSIENETSRLGYSIILSNTDYNKEKEIQYLNVLKRYRVDGILLVPCDRRAPHLDDLNDSKIPTVVITLNIPGFDSVFISHYQAGQQVARHFLNLGYSGFLFAGDPDDEKEAGYRDELEAAGIDIENHYLSLPKKIMNLNPILKEWMERERSSGGIAVFAYNDVQALIVLHALTDIHAKIPEEAGLAGFDNTFISRGVSPSITSVAQPIEEIGRIGVEKLIHRIQAHHSLVTSPPQHVELATRIIARETTIRTKTT